MTDTLKAGIFTTLSAESTITMLVGTRIYPDAAPQGESLPYITYDAISELGVHNMVGVNTLARTEIQFTVRAQSSDSRTAVKNALREFLDGTIRTNFGSSFVARVWNTNNVDTKEDPDDGSQDTVYGVFMDFNFWHTR